MNPTSSTALKWTALASMVIDHLRYIYTDVPLLHDIGRLAYPIFAFVLASNLYRVKAAGDLAALDRTGWRLLAFGALAQPASMVLHGGWMPLNIMFTMALSVLLLRTGALGAMLAFIVLGAFPEYRWGGQLFFLASFYLCGAMATRQRVELAACLWLAGFTLLAWNAHNLWVYAALPVILAAQQWQPGFELPRMKHFFYAFYPVHLSLLAAWAWIR